MAFNQIDLPESETSHLCWIVAKSRNHEHRLAAANLLARRKTAVPPCRALLAADFAMVDGIVAAASAGATRTSGGYAVAWDRFVTEGGQALWQCRELGSGQFVYNYLCLGKQLHDGVWAGDVELVFVDQTSMTDGKAAQPDIPLSKVPGRS